MSNKVTIKSLKEKISKLNNEYNNLETNKSPIKEIVDAYKEYIRAKNNFIETKSRYYPALHEHRNRIENEKIKIQKEIETLKNKIEVPTAIIEWLRTKYRGIDVGSGGFTKNIKISWMSDDQQFLIITEKGHMYMSGLAIQRYGITDHYAVRAFDENFEVIGNRINQTGRNTISPVVEGRLTKDKKQKMIKDINKYRKSHNV